MDRRSSVNKPRKRFATPADQNILSVKVKKEIKTPVKNEVDPATDKINKESARKLIDQLKLKIPTIPSPVKRESPTNQFSQIKLEPEYELAHATDLFNALDVETETAIMKSHPDVPPPAPDSTSVADSSKTILDDQELEDSELSFCTLEDLCKPSELDKQPHLITSRNGKSVHMEQEQVDLAAAGNIVNCSTLLKSAS